MPDTTVMKQHKVTFRVDDRLLKAMKAEAKKAGLDTVSSWLRIVAHEEIKRARREQWEA